VTRGSFPVRAASLKEGSALYGVSVDTLRRRIATGELHAYRLGKQIIRIDLDELEALFSTIPTVGRDAS
jgi:excisionase family DNA binding protein